MTAEERVASLHARMQVYSRKQEKRRTVTLGISCTVLAASLLAMAVGIRAEAGAGVLVPAAAAAVLAAVLAAAVLRRQQTVKQQAVSETHINSERFFMKDGDLFAVAGGQKDGKEEAEQKNRTEE